MTPLERAVTWQQCDDLCDRIKNSIRTQDTERAIERVQVMLKNLENLLSTNK